MGVVSRRWEGTLNVMVGKVVATPIRVPKLVLRSWKKDPVDSVSRSEEEIEDIVGDESGGSNSIAGSTIFISSYRQCSDLCLGYIGN